MKQAERSSSLQAGARPPWGRYAGDSALSVGGVFLITSVIAVAHLYPRIPTIAFVYLLLVLTLASTRGLYAAILTSLLAFLCFDFFFFPPPYTFLVTKAEDLFTLVVFLTTAIITGQLALALRRRAEQASSRERELRILYKQTQQLVSLQNRHPLPRELHDSISQVLYCIAVGAHKPRDAFDKESTPEKAAEEYH